MTAEASSEEGVAFEAKADVRIEVPRGNLADLLRDSGYSTYRNILRVSAEEVCKRQNLAQSIRASIQTFVRASGFFDLANHEQARADLNQKVQQECSRARLVGELISIELSPKLPESDQLAELRARASSEPSLQGIVKHFRETLLQRELLNAEAERAKAESVRAKADRKIVEAEEEDRVSARQAELQQSEADRQRTAQERNAQIKENSAQYEFVYKTKRLEEDRQLAEKEVEVAKVKEAQASTLREQRKLDMELDIERERSLAEIRGAERAKVVAEIASVFVTMKELPLPSYEGIHTLVTTAGDSRDQVTGLLWNLLTRFSDSPRLGEGEATKHESKAPKR
ncbi:MAG: hypothetical protein HYV63_27715 [Candidatus Schekmanbacteria bacterium]|nr:hypothetical protein [Candidatus Schekmanbacteria bacterium]